MICVKCSNWKWGKMTYQNVLSKWHDLIGSMITPGYLKRFEREAANKNLPVDELTIGFKYCAAGIFNRLYVMKSENDYKPVKNFKSCPSFSTCDDSETINYCSPAPPDSAISTPTGISRCSHSTSLMGRGTITTIILSCWIISSS